MATWLPVSNSTRYGMAVGMCVLIGFSPLGFLIWGESTTAPNGLQALFLLLRLALSKRFGFTIPPVDQKTISAVMSELGKSRSKKKLAAVRKNLQAANRARLLKQRAKAAA